MFTVRIRGCSHFIKLKCIRKKMGPGKSVHYRGCSHFWGVHIPRFHCIQKYYKEKKVTERHLMDEWITPP